MSKRYKINSANLARALSLAFLLSWCLLCFSGGLNPLKADEEDLRVMVWTWSDEVDEVLDNAVTEYEETNNIDIYLIRVIDETDHHIKYNYELTGTFYGERPPDILWMDPDWITKGEFLLFLTPLDEFFDNQDPETVLGASSEVLSPYMQSTDAGLQLYGIPIGNEGTYTQSCYTISKSSYRSGRAELAFDFIMFLRNRIPVVPATFVISDLIITPEKAFTGETVTISAVVSNTGTLAGTHELDFKIDGESVYTEELTLTGGESQRVTYTTPPGEEGSHIVIVGTLSDLFTVQPIVPATFTTNDLSITPSEISQGEEVTISVLVSNNGTLSGNHEVDFMIGDTIIYTEEINLDGGASQVVTHTTTIDDTGSHTVSVDGLSGSLTVAKTPFQWPSISFPAITLPAVNLPSLLGIYIAIAAAAVGVVVFLRSRKKRQRIAWQEKAKEEEAGEPSEPGISYCRKIKLGSKGVAYNVRYLDIGAVNFVSEEKRGRQVRGEIINSINDVITAYCQRVPAEELQNRLEKIADELLHKILRWLHGENVPHNVTITAMLEGGYSTYQFILYKSKQQGNVNIWQEKDNWKADVDYQNDELIGNLHRLDPHTPKISELQTELVGLLMKFIDKIGLARALDQEK